MVKKNKNPDYYPCDAIFIFWTTISSFPFSHEWSRLQRSLRLDLCSEPGPPQRQNTGLNSGNSVSAPGLLKAPAAPAEAKMAGPGRRALPLGSDYQLSRSDRAWRGAISLSRHGVTLVMEMFIVLPSAESLASLAA